MLRSKVKAPETMDYSKPSACSDLHCKRSDRSCSVSGILLIGLQLRSRTSCLIKKLILVSMGKFRGWTLVQFFQWSSTNNIEFTILAVSKCTFSSIECIHDVVQPSLSARASPSSPREAPCSRSTGWAVVRCSLPPALGNYGSASHLYRFA